MTVDCVKDCFATALKDENKDRKHKGLLKYQKNYLNDLLFFTIILYARYTKTKN